MAQAGLKEKASSQGGLDISDTPLVLLILELFRDQANGLLVVTSNKARRKLLLRNGLPISASSNLRSETYGQLLHEADRLTDEQFEKLNALGPEVNKDPAAALSKLGYFVQEEIEKLVHFAQGLRLQNLVKLANGQAQFAEQQVTSDQPALDGAIRLLLDASKSNFPLQRIHSDFPQLANGNFVRVFEDRLEELQGAKVSPEEKGVLTIAKDSAHIADIVGASFLSEEEVMRNLLVLFLLGLIETENENDHQNRLLENSLTDDDREKRQQITNMLETAKQFGFIALLGLPDEFERSDVEEAGNKLLKQVNPEVTKKLFAADMQSIPDQLAEQIKQGCQVLMDPAKKKEYLQFVKEGRAHEFGAGSSTLAVEKSLKAGVKLFNSKKYADALTNFEEATKIQPNNATALTWCGISHFKANKDAEAALSMFNRAIESDPQYDLSYFYAAEIKTAQGLKQEAIDYYCRALRANPLRQQIVDKLEKIDADLALRTQVGGLFDSLNRLNYYELLGLEIGAKSHNIRSAYRKMTKRFHPDRHYTSSDDDLKHQTKKIYQRAVEAHLVLRNPLKRQEYDLGLNADNNEESQVRLKDAKDVVQKKERSDIQIKTETGKKFYKLGITAIQQKNYNSAVMNFKLALNAEPDNEHIQKHLKEAEQKARL